ncbi:MAG: hypothetical protein SGCHY_005508 [Lobulomycetales sp.]
MAILVSGELAGALYMGGWSLAYPLIYLHPRSWAKLILSVAASSYFILLFLFFQTPLYFVNWLLCGAGCMAAMKVVDLYLSPESVQMTLIDYICFSQGLPRDGMVSHIKMSDDNSVSVRIAGLGKIAGAGVKYICARLVAQHFMFDMVNDVDDSDFVKSSIGYYTCGLFLYLIVSFIGDALFGMYQAVLGVPMKNLFNAPFLSTSPRDFWSRRWNRLFSHCFHRIIFRFRPSQRWGGGTFAMAVFLLSGIFHEYINYTTLGTDVLGDNMIFFLGKS